MTLYDKTWNNDSPAYNAATARALNKIQDNLEIPWNIKTNSTWNSISSPSVGTTYTNNSGYPALYVVAAKANGGPNQGFLNLSNGDASTVIVEVNDTGSFVTRMTINAAGAGLLGAGREDLTQYLSFILNDGDSVRVTKTSGGNSLAAVDFIYNFVFDAHFTKAAFTHGEVVSSIAAGKLKDYVDGVNGTCPVDGDMTHVQLNVGSNVETTVGSVARFACFSHPSTGTLQLKDSGGSQVSFNGSGNTPANVACFPAIVNAGGSWEANNAANNAGDYHFDFPTPPQTSFTSGENGTSVGNKFRNMDGYASSGVNPTSDWTRQSTTGSGLHKPSTTNWSFVYASADTTGNGSIQIRLNGTDNMGFSSVDKTGNTICAFGLVPADEEWDLVVTNATLKDRFYWTVDGVAGAASNLFSIDNEIVDEDDGTVTMTVTRAAPSGDSDIDYSTSDRATAIDGDDAIVVEDYTSTSGTLSFTGSETSKTFTVPIINNGYREPDRQFKVNLSGVENGSVDVGQATVTIQDDEATATFLEDISGNDYDLTAGSVATTNAVCPIAKFGGGQEFTAVANKTLTISDNAFAITGSLCITLVVDINALAGATNQQALIYYGLASASVTAATSAAFGFGQMTSIGNNAMRFSQNDGAGGQVFFNGPTITTGLHTYTIRRDSVAKTIVVKQDGVEIINDTYTNDPVPDIAAILAIGGRGDGNVAAASASSIYDLRIWDQLVDQSVLDAIVASSGKNAPEGNELAHYRMEDF